MSPARPLSSSDTSIRSPSPRFTAARIATAACKPVSTSTIATPTFIGSPSASPVIDMMPLSACATKS